MKARVSPAFHRSCPTWTRHRRPLRLRRNRPARRNPPNAQTRKLLDRSSRLSVRRIKSLRNRLLARLGANGYRSEEHTSELQSLMRISYAVFCLKKKKNLKNTIQTTKKNHYHTELQIIHV